MAWTQADVDALKAAIATGIRRVRYNDREVEYQSIDQMQAALGLMAQEVATATGTAKPFIRLGTRKGF